jgi:hypothetical protein
MYVFGCRLSLFRLCRSDFGITPTDIANRITWAVFCFHIAHISFACSWYLLLLLFQRMFRTTPYRLSMKLKAKVTSFYNLFQHISYCSAILSNLLMFSFLYLHMYTCTPTHACTHAFMYVYIYVCTRWFKYDRDWFFLKTLITKHLLAHRSAACLQKNQPRSYLNHLV